MSVHVNANVPKWVGNMCLDEPKMSQSFTSAHAGLFHSGCSRGAHFLCVRVPKLAPKVSKLEPINDKAL